MNPTFLEILKLLIPVVAVVTGWLVNERSKRKWEEYTRKEANYRALLSAVKGFYVETGTRQEKNAFLEQVNLCWLYCPDEVIKRAYAFLTLVHTGSNARQEETMESMGNFVAAVRRDLISRRAVKNSQLDGKDFRHMIAS